MQLQKSRERKGKERKGRQRKGKKRKGMEGWKDGTKNRMQKERETKKTRKVWIIKAQPRCAPNLIVYFLQQTNYMQQNDMASVLCACKDGKHADAIFWQPRRAPQITVLSEYFCRANIISKPSGKSAHGALKATKIRFINYTRIL